MSARNARRAAAVPHHMGKAAVCLVCCAGLLFGQSGRVPLSGHIHPYATAANDQGRIDPSTPMAAMSLMLRPSADRQAQLDALLARQQDPSSPDYHRWLTPEQYGDRFGATQADLEAISAWLKSRNLTVLNVARGRNKIDFNGSAGDVEKAFSIEIHRYSVKGELHFANADEPSLPSVIADKVASIAGLHDFKLRHGRLRASYTSATSGNHYLAPDDIAAIYDLKPLYAAGITGAGQTVAVAGQTQIDPADIRQFRTYFNLPPNDPLVTLVPNFPDPGVSSDDLAEADLDIEWTGATARNAAIRYVYSANVFDAIQYIVDQNLAPVVTSSYGDCEQVTQKMDMMTYRAIAQQAASQGISWLNASGDNGGVDCFDPTVRTVYALGVDTPADVPEVTGVGGTEFSEGSGTYWNATNDANRASALSYIPEAVWNDSVADMTPSASGGGASTVFTKPSWQTGPGVPSDGARDVPDISLAASADHDGYMVFTGGDMSPEVFGGTSVATPIFAGIAALLNQYQVSNGFQPTAGMGSLNARLYALAQATPAAFHDVTSGDNKVDPCPPKARACNPATLGYSAGPGYDLATGLGSVDAANLVSAWHGTGAVSKKAATISASSGASSVKTTDSVALTATVSGSGAAPTGSVVWSLGGAVLGKSSLTASGAALTLAGSLLPAGSVVIGVEYSGDAVYNPAFASVSLGVTAPPSLTISSAVNAASFATGCAPGMIMAIFGTLMAGATASAATVPLPTSIGGVTVSFGGTPAPLYFVSPTQINAQVPYGLRAGTVSTLSVSYNGQTATKPVVVTEAAPGVFVDPSNGAPVPNESAQAGKTVTLFITGEGRSTPLPTTGATPAAATTPQPNLPVCVTVGGTQASTSYIGIPSWSIGATQVNYTIPSGVSAGRQPVVVSVGGLGSGCLGGQTAPAAPISITP